jgi:hypothetical protein
MSKIFIMLLTMVTLSSFSVCRSESSEEVAVTIKKIQCRKFPPSGGASVLLGLSFTNLSKEDIKLDLVAEYGKGEFELTEPSNLFVLAGGKAEPAVNLAYVEYSWRKPNHSVIVKGRYDLSTPSYLAISRGASVDLTIPISAPGQPGTYDLSICFDNKSLSSALSSYNSGPGRFPPLVKVEARKRINIEAPSHRKHLGN